MLPVGSKSVTTGSIAPGFLALALLFSAAAVAAALAVTEAGVAGGIRGACGRELLGSFLDGESRFAAGLLPRR
ncbi:hypothetical protein PAHAL_2G288900 [Panicum hallii]|uniref:Uncharacterized protein n=1 Tax=Panicum hallii TaxID=206008 RepID=A0A2S3H0G9_9POAL|nr:hypothetical protein PAHAL_2G288900 [Panicum hallii]